MEKAGAKSPDFSNVIEGSPLLLWLPYSSKVKLFPSVNPANRFGVTEVSTDTGFVTELAIGRLVFGTTTGST